MTDNERHYWAEQSPLSLVLQLPLTMTYRYLDKHAVSWQLVIFTRLVLGIHPHNYIDLNIVRQINSTIKNYYGKDNLLYDKIGMLNFEHCRVFYIKNKVKLLTEKMRH